MATKNRDQGSVPSLTASQRDLHALALGEARRSPIGNAFDAELAQDCRYAHGQGGGRQTVQPPEVLDVLPSCQPIV